MTAFVLLFGGLLGGEIYGLFIHETGVPRVDRGADARLLGEIAGSTAVAQTFSVGVDGFDGVTVEARPFGGVVAGTAVFDVARIDPVLGSSAQVTPLYRILRPARDVVRAPRYRVSFPPVEGSRGGYYRIEIRVPDAGPGQGLGLWATRHQAYRGGILTVDGHEAWGDLVFRASAVRATPFRDVQQRLAAWQPAAGSPWLLGVLLLGYNAGLAFVTWFLVSGAGAAGGSASRREAREVPPAAVTGPAGAAPADAATLPTGVRPAPVPVPAAAGFEARRRRALVVSAVVVVAGVAGVSSVRTAPDDLEPGALDLLARFPDAEKRTTMPSLEEGFDIQTVTIAGERRRSLFAPPFSRVIWTVPVPERAVLRTAAALRPDAWEHPTDGALFRVGIADRGTYTEFFKQMIRPHDEPGDRRWVSVEVDLSPYAGRTVKVIFNTEPGPHGAGFADACVWGAPRIVTR